MRTYSQIIVVIDGTGTLIKGGAYSYIHVLPNELLFKLNSVSKFEKKRAGQIIGV